MSSSGRTTSKGGKGAKADKCHKSDGGKGGGDKIHNKEPSSKIEELSIKDKVKQLMELTRRSEDEVCLALHESDNDVNVAINMLFEEIRTGEWETKDKKKKKRQASAGKQDKRADEGTGSDDWDEVLLPTVNIAGAGDGKEWKERGGGRKDNTNYGGSNRSYNRNIEGRRWRGRDRDQNEEAGGRGGDRSGGRSQGTTRGGGGRGRGGGRAGGRYPSRGNRGGSGSGRDYDRQPIDTWENSNTWDNNTAASAATNNHTTANDDWDDFHTDEWSTEEYTGSLVETKVFTPSVQPNMDIIETSTHPPGLDQNLPGTVHQDASTYSQPLGHVYNQRMQIPSQQSPVPSMVGTLTAAQTQYFSQLSQQNSDTLNKQFTSVAYQPQGGYEEKPDVQQVYSSSTSQVYSPATLSYSSPQQSYSNAAQPYTTQAYSVSPQKFNNSSQSFDNSQPYSNSSKSYNNSSQSFTNQSQSYNNSSQSYSNTQPSYGSSPPNNTFANNGYQTVSDSYGTTQETQPVQQPTRAKTQKARVPPPSKIPASAVEMPGDLNSSITYLDVQFGALDLIDSSFDSNAASDVKYGTENNRSTSALENSNNTPTTGLDLGTPTSSNQSAGLEAYAMTKNGSLNSTISSALSQGLSNAESIPQTSEHLTYNTASTRNAAQGAGVSSVSSVTAPTALDLKQPTDCHSYSSQTSTYNAYQSKTSTYNSSPYNTAQTTASSYVNSAATNYVTNQASSYGSTTQNSSSYPNSYSSASVQSYQNAASAAAANATYPSVTHSATANSYQGSNSYPSTQNTSQSVYGANAALGNNSNYGGTTPSQFNTYSTATNNHKLEKENTYGTNSIVVSSTSSTTTSNVTSSSTPISSSSSQTTSSSKNTATLAKSSNSVVSNIPPGVTPVMSTPYIMGQVPYFQQPVYSYEDMQLLQQRLPHMTTPYYDMGYQTPTTLAAVRGDPTGGLGGYSTISADGRFATTAARGDGNTSPVPSSTLAAAVQNQASTLTAQQGHQGQPILAAGTGPPYFFATAFNTIAAAPNYAQFGAMYTQLPPATNAHGSSTSSQYAPKPATYGSAGYGAYDALGQTAQDYAKSGYTVGTAAAVAAAQQAQKSQSNSTTGGSAANDLSAMYGKSHAALGKVNSYEKQGFHSGTPPPFTGALHGSQNAGLAPGGTGYTQQVYIPTMPPQHHSTMPIHQPLHQDSGNSSGQRSQGSNQSKAGSKPYGTSYWNQN